MQKIFSYPLKLEDMSKNTQTYLLKASPEELEFITEIMQVPAVRSFVAKVNVELNSREHRADIWGNVEADVEQESVVSLEDFTRHYATDFALVFDTKMTLAEQMAMEIENEDAEVPDILDDGQVDLAAVAMEQLALILDDFPRKDGEVFKFESEFDEETTQNNNPFAVLKNLKK